MRRILFLVGLVSLAAAGAAPVGAPWQHPLTLSGGGYWPMRVAVTIRNTGDTPLEGEPVAAAIPALAGSRIESFRAVNEAGQELLFDVRDAGGHAKRAGALAAGDQIIVPAECAAKGSATLYVYAGNDDALPVPDFLPSGFANGDFESGANVPADWEPAMGDAQHVLTWEPQGGRNGSRGVKVEVAQGAEGTWVQWRQDGIPVKPGRTYRLSAWVRGEGVAGTAGWYVHVNGEKPQMVNQTLRAGEGTFGWKEVTASFTVPAGGATATVGTVLNGTGRAWYDDCTVTADEAGPSATATAGPVERLTLVLDPPAQTGFSQEWPYRATVRVMNLTPDPVSQAMVYADLRSLRGRIYKLRPDAAINVIDAITGRPVSPCLRIRDGVLFAASVPARSIREYRIFFSETRRESEGAFLSAYEHLVDGPLNLAPNGGFEAGEAMPEGWACTGEAGTKEFQAGTAADARFGKRCAMVTVAPEAKIDWVGWRSGEIPVQPGATYFYSGFLKTKAVTGSAVLHAHLHGPDGKLIASGAYLSTQPPVSADSPWTQTSTFVRAPGDAASIQLHLTMNAKGTLQHDGVLFCRVLPGEVTRVDCAETAQTAGGLRVWEVNPLVKVFPDALPGAPAKQVTVESARGELEPFQLVLRSGKAAQGVQVAVSPLANRRGAALPPVKIERVGFVPIDHPSGYYQSLLPAWYRRVPQGQGSTDGWAGEWPDPLIPGARFDLEAGRAQPLWLTVSVPRQAAPGEYQGRVLIQAPGEPAATVTLRVTVLPFALPEHPTLKTIFDLRSGSYGDIFAGGGEEAQRKWLRFMADHWIGTDHIPGQVNFSYANGKVSMDAAEFDRMARYCFDELGMTVCYTPSFLYAFGWAYPPKKLFGFEAFTPEYIDAFKQAYRLFSEHVKEKGWHDKFVYYISDEPHFNLPEVVAQMRRLCALAHEVDPKMPIYSSTWRHCPEWDDSLDIWGVGQYGCFPTAEMERLQKLGKQMWFTCDGQMATDTPYLATERMLPYYCFRYGATGFEFWGLSWWTFNPWERGWHTYIRQSDDGKRQYWIRYPNGDGFLTYPGRPIGVDGPVSTIRLEEVRQGLEDYEALRILSDLAARAKREGRWTGEAEAALAAARDLAPIPNAGGLRSSEILPDPDRLPAIRKAVNAAIAHLWK